MTRLVRLSILTCCILFACNSFATTYYIDYSTGSDANSGTSKTSAWQNAPGMQTCSKVCKSTTIAPGGSIILRGGVTWPNASFMWTLPSGSSGSPVYVGVDQTWYTGTSWTRPILNAGGSAIQNNYDTMFNVDGWTTFDNFEITGFYWTAASCSGAPFGECGFFDVGQHDGFVLEHSYIHGWTHAGTGSTTSSGVVDIWGGSGGANCSAHDNVIVGTDVPGDHSVNAFFAGPVLAYNNYIRQVSSGFIVSTYGIGVSATYHDNYIYDVGPAYCNVNPSNPGNCTHENGFEDNGDAGLYFYNNVVANTSFGLALWIAPNPSYTAYLWNNLIYAVHDTQVIDLAASIYDSALCSAGPSGQGYCNKAGSFVLWNNTVECGDDTTLYDSCQSQIGQSFSGATSFNYQNNHFITATTAKGCGASASNCTFASSNVVQTLAQANGQGYNSSEVYPFSPAASNDATVGAGSSLSTQASGAVSTLSSDTTLACSDGAGNVASCPARASKNRTGSSWDAGAYAWGVRPNGAQSLSGSLVKTN